jgi:energy-coupling factor transporter ATP-binding protein EcfA2
MSKLIILRGNSGSGKSTIANLIAKSATTKTAIVDADYYRVTMLFPKPFDGDDLGALMRQDVLYCLNHDYTVFWDSIFYATDTNKEYLGEVLVKQHPSDNYIFNFDVSLAEAVRRHELRPKSNDFTTEEMKSWYKPVEKLGFEFEYQIPESYTIEETVEFIKQTAGL